MNADQSTALIRLFDEIPATFHRLKVVAADVHGQDVPSAGRRGILRSLDRLGPQTVPQLARARPVSRQHIQVLVSGLLNDGLVATEENPAHRKSALVRLTAKGRRQLLASQTRETQLLAHVTFELTATEIDRAADVLRSLRALLGSKKWSDYAATMD
jgi:DNA-binding MarR family transcriptional regulator